MTENPSLDLMLFTAVIVLVLCIAAIYIFSGRRQESESDSYTHALESLAEGNPRLAIERFKEASDNIAAYIQLGDLLRDKGLYSNAIRIHRDLTAREYITIEQRQRILKSLLLDYKASENFDRGIETANQLLKIQRKPSADTLKYLLSMLERSNLWRDAYNLVNKHSGHFPDYRKQQALYLVFEALSFQNNGSIKEAKQRFKEALKKDSTCAAAYYHLGKMYFEEKRLDDALQQWKKLCEKIPSMAHITFPELEKTCFELGRYNVAVSFYQDLIANNENRLEPGLALAEIYDKKGEYDNAIEVLNLLEEHQESPVLIARKINLYFNKGQYKLAADQSRTYFLNGGTRNRRVYVCSNCGHKSQTPLWVCKKCGKIDSYNLSYHS